MAKTVKLQNNYTFGKGAGVTPQNVPKPNTVDLPGIKGTLPFTGDRIINPTGNVPKDVRNVEREMQAQPMPKYDPKEYQKVHIPEPVDIDSLAEDKRQEVLQNVKTMMSREPVKSQFIPRGPGIAEAKFKADQVAAETEERIRQSRENRRTLPKITPPPKDMPPVEDIGKEELQNEEVQTVTDTTPLICPHCNWPVNSKDNCNPTKQDKQLFTAAVLGQVRFIKEYALLGGQVNVVFRSLTVEESDLIIKQMIDDWNNGRITGPAHSISEATKYQLALALSSVETNVGPISLPTLDEYDCEEPEVGTILPAVADYVRKTAMSHEPLRRIISKAYGHFLETQSKLEAMAESSDFWSATEE